MQQSALDLSLCSSPRTCNSEVSGAVQELVGAGPSGIEPLVRRLVAHSTSAAATAAAPYSGCLPPLVCQTLDPYLAGTCVEGST